MSVHVVTSQDFEEKVLKDEGIVLVDFYADWCGPCKMLAPFLDELSSEMTSGVVKFAKLNVDTSPTEAIKYGIQGIPNVIIFKAGKPVKQVVGLRPKEYYRQLITEILFSRDS